MRQENNELKVENWELRNDLSSCKIQLENAQPYLEALESLKMEVPKVLRMLQQYKNEKEEALDKLKQKEEQDRMSSLQLDQFIELYDFSWFVVDDNHK